MKTRILLLGPLPPPFGGPEVMTQTLLEGLGRRQEFIVRHLNTQVSRSLAEKGGKHQLRKAVRGAVQVARLIALLLSFRPHVLYLPLTNSPSFLGFVRDALLILPGLALGTQAVIRLHGGYYFYSHARGIRGALVRAVFRRVGLVMVQGQRVLSEFQGLVAMERIAIIPNGIDGRPFEGAAMEREREGTRGRRRVLFVGLMCREKGFRDVLAAVPLVPDAEFVFAGEWPSLEEEHEVRLGLGREGVQDRVIFRGVVTGPAKSELFASSHIFVLPSCFVYEGHPVSSVEALAAGLPIICTDHGALGESVRDGWNGFFVPRSDPPAIARRVNQLLADEALRRNMGERSRKLFEKRFTLMHFIEAWSQAVRACVPGPSRDEEQREPSVSRAIWRG